MLKEDWCITTYNGFDDFISANIYIKLTKEEYDNFDPKKHEYIYKELKCKIIELHNQGMTGEEIADILNKEIDSRDELKNN